MKNFFAALGLLWTATSVATPPSPMQEGLWEITAQSAIPGAKTQPPPTTTSTCYTRADVESENFAIPKDERCTVDDYQLTGNTASWRVKCAGKEKITGNGTLTFHGRTAYSGKAQLRMRIEGQQEILISNAFSAKRVGDCNR